MTKKVSVLLMFALMVSLCGCQLAKGEELVEHGQSMTDKLIGAFITEEHLDLFDMEAYLNDNLDSIMSGKELGPGEQAQYEGRIYATPAGYLENGLPDGHFTFEGLEGYAYFTPTVEHPEGETTVVNADSCFSDIKNNYHSVDNNLQEISTEATLYVADDVGHVAFFMNPVYQDDSGNVYLMAGTGISSDMVGSMSQSMDMERKVTIDDVETTEKYAIKITYKGIPRPERIAVLQMDAESRVLSREEYLPGQLPEQIDPVEGADYIILETITREETIREVVPQEERWMHTYDPQDNGICEQQSTEVLWKDWDA